MAVLHFFLVNSPLIYILFSMGIYLPTIFEILKHLKSIYVKIVDHSNKILTLFYKNKSLNKMYNCLIKKT